MEKLLIFFLLFLLACSNSFGEPPGESIEPEIPSQDECAQTKGYMVHIANVPAGDLSGRYRGRFHIKPVKTMLKSDYFYVRKAEVRADKDLNFVESVRVTYNDRLILWSDGLDGERNELNFNGSIPVDIDGDKKIYFGYELEGKFPDQKTKVDLYFEVILYCQSQEI